MRAAVGYSQEEAEFLHYLQMCPFERGINTVSLVVSTPLQTGV